MRCFHFVKPLSLLLLAIVLLFPFSSYVTAQASHQTEKQSVTITGHVYCLDNSGKRLPVEQDCQPSTVKYELLANDGRSFPILSDDLLATIFTEARIRKMELQISGLLHHDKQLELVKIQALHNGKLFDIFYYCEVCKITAYGPGPCPCCYAPLEFIEKPANDQ
jgi:hypothetical protein